MSTIPRTDCALTYFYTVYGSNPVENLQVGSTLVFLKGSSPKLESPCPHQSYGEL
uniref:Uncharacterized protein n=1 Tax=Anguilla anguilla TaxID=7936 RepID=A0A0E9R845_ANGAN